MGRLIHHTEVAVNSLATCAVEIAKQDLDDFAARELPCVGPPRATRQSVYDNLVAVNVFAVTHYGCQIVPEHRRQDFISAVVGKAAQIYKPDDFASFIDFLLWRRTGYIGVLKAWRDSGTPMLAEYFSACCTVARHYVAMDDIWPNPDEINTDVLLTEEKRKEAIELANYIRAMKDPAVYHTGTFLRLETFTALMGRISSFKGSVEEILREYYLPWV